MVQRIPGHAPAAKTMDRYGHLIDHNLWDSAKRLGGILGASDAETEGPASTDGGEEGA